MDFLVSQFPGFSFGALVGAVVMFFVYRNNKKDFDKKYAELEASITKAQEDAKLEDRVKEILGKIGGKQ